MLERLAGHSHYCFLDGYSGYNQIAIAPEDQEKTTFTVNLVSQTSKRTEKVVRPSKLRILAGPPTENNFNPMTQNKSYKNFTQNNHRT